jgi:hypothetical protein
MEATRDHDATLVDLLDRVLEKGLVLHADVIISVSGVPLIGLKLSALLASVDTMIKYGIWADWDCAIRAAATEQEQRRLLEVQRCLNGELPVLRSLCSCRQQDADGTWKNATLYLTGSRIVFTERTSPVIQSGFELVHLTGFSINEGPAQGTAIQYLNFLLDDGTTIALRSLDVPGIVRGVGTEMKRLGRSWTNQDTGPFAGNAAPAHNHSPPPLPGAGI